MVAQAGQQFGAYQLTSLLAESSTAQIYRGEQRYSHINVAIKLLRRLLATPEEIDAFRAEARALARLIHPHIVRTLGFDVHEQRGFLVMDYAPGGTLRQRHPGGAVLTLETILPHVKQAADALYYAHEQGILHQALKPESLLVGRQDEILLGGFHLASAYQPAEAQPLAEIDAITAYLAPEQLQGRPCAASDQYALGVIVYEWLSGTLPFQGSGAALAQQILQAALPSLHAAAPALAPAVERVVMRAMAKDPAKRFADVQAFAAALEEAAQAEPVPQPAAASAAAAKPTSRQPAATARAAAPHTAAAHHPAGQPHTSAPAAQQPTRTRQPAPTQAPAERFGPPAPPAWQGQPPASRAPAPPPQVWPRQPAQSYPPASPPAWQRPPAPVRSPRSSSTGCIVMLIVMAVILLIFLISTASTH